MRIASLAAELIVRNFSSLSDRASSMRLRSSTSLARRSRDTVVFFSSSAILLKVRASIPTSSLEFASILASRLPLPISMLASSSLRKDPDIERAIRTPMRTASAAIAALAPIIRILSLAIGANISSVSWSIISIQPRPL